MHGPINIIHALIHIFDIPSDTLTDEPELEMNRIFHPVFWFAEIYWLHVYRMGENCDAR